MILKLKLGLYKSLNTLCQPFVALNPNKKHTYLFITLAAFLLAIFLFLLGAFLFGFLN